MPRRGSRAPIPISPIELRQIALVELLMDERTFKKVLLGGKVLASTRERVRRALAARGLEHLLPAEAR